MCRPPRPGAAWPTWWPSDSTEPRRRPWRPAPSSTSEAGFAVEHLKVSGAGHRAVEAWALSFGPVARWGVEGASGLGRHTAAYLVGRGHDVRDCCATRTAERARIEGFEVRQIQAVRLR